MVQQARKLRVVHVTPAAQMALVAMWAPLAESPQSPGPHPPVGRRLSRHSAVGGLTEMPHRGLVVLLGPQEEGQYEDCCTSIPFE